MSREPAWFAAALATEPRREDIDGRDVRTACRTWGPRDAPTIVLVHGGAAHAGWWDHVAPALAEHHRVVALDLAGHGDSGWLPKYTLAAWCHQVVEVVRSRPTAAPVLLVGHSMGGVVAMLAARQLGDEIAALLVVDSEVPVDRADFVRPEWTATTARRIYPGRDEILARFRTLPTDGGHLAFVTRHVAALSVTEVTGGWSWKFDPRFFEHDRISIDDLEPLTVPVIVVRGEHGLVEPMLAERVAHALGQPHPPVTIPGSGHHVPLDEPVALISVIALAARAWCRAPADLTESRPTPEGAR